MSSKYKELIQLKVVLFFILGYVLGTWVLQEQLFDNRFKIHIFLIKKPVSDNTIYLVSRNHDSTDKIKISTLRLLLRAKQAIV